MSALQRGRLMQIRAVLTTSYRLRILMPDPRPELHCFQSI